MANNTAPIRIPPKYSNAIEVYPDFIRGRFQLLGSYMWFRWCGHISKFISGSTDLWIQEKTMKNCCDINNGVFLNSDIDVLYDNLRYLNEFYNKLEIRLPTEAEIRMLKAQIHEAPTARSDIDNLMEKIWVNAPLASQALFLYLTAVVDNPETLDIKDRRIYPEEPSWEYCIESPDSIEYRDGVKMINIFDGTILPQRMITGVKHRTTPQVDYRLVLISK